MSGAFLIIFTLFWSGMVLFFDGLMVRGIYKQQSSTHYTAVTGAITHSEIKTQLVKGGKSYSAAIEYQYEVGGHKFTGKKIRFGLTSSSSSNAWATVNAHPLGSTVQVFYDPASPQESLLSPGINGSDFMFTLFLTPFNMVMLGLWLWIGGWLRERFFRPVAGGVKIVADGMTTRIRLPRFPAMAWGIGATGILGFISIFAVGVATGMNPSIPMTLSAIALIYGAGFAVYLWQWRKINSGIDDMIINDGSRSLDLPLTFGRKERMTANLADIVCLSVEKIEHRSNKGGISYTYAPTLSLRKTEPATQKLADWSDKLKADEFTEWLRKQLGANIPSTFVAPVSEDEGANNIAALKAPANEIRRPENSKIKVSDGPNGREFYFSAARNIGTALFLTLFTLIFNGIAVVAYHFHAPILFPIAFGIVGILLIFGTFSLWLKSVRVTVNSTNVRLTKRWLIFSRTREFSAGDYARFTTKMGMQSGSTIFTDIKLVRSGADTEFAQDMGKNQDVQQVNQLVVRRLRQAVGPRGVTVAGSIANSAEANWLVAEMNRALGQTQSTPAISPEEATDETTDWSPTDVRPKKATAGIISALISIAMACGISFWIWQQHSAATASPSAQSSKTAVVPKSPVPKPAPSQVAFSSFGADGTCETNSWPVGHVGYANWFVSKTSGRLRTIELSVEPADTPPERMMVAIAPDKGGFPGRALETFRVDGLAHTNTSDWLELDSRKQPALEAGTKYWVWARSPGTWLWHFNNQNIMQEAAHLPKRRKWTDAGYTNVCVFSVLTERNKPLP